jgi:hypothetical protein
MNTYKFSNNKKGLQAISEASFNSSKSSTVDDEYDLLKSKIK